jgi:hypothetical protein
LTYENASAALSGRAFTAEAFDFAIRVNLVVLQNGHLDLLALVLGLLWGLKEMSKDQIDIKPDTENDIRCMSSFYASWHHHEDEGRDEE